MTISISNLRVPYNAPSNTTVGVLTATDEADNIIPCNFILTKRSGGYFAISTDELITVWGQPISPGYYSVVVHAVGIQNRFSASATFTVTVTAAVSPPPPAPPILQWDTGFNSNFTYSSNITTNDTALHTFVNSAQNARSNGSVSSGKYYFEGIGTNLVSNNTSFGICDGSLGTSTQAAGSTHAAVNTASFGVVAGGSNVNVGVAVDVGNQKVWFRANGGTWTGTAAGDPVAGTNGISIAGFTGAAVYVVASSLSAGSEQYRLLSGTQSTYTAPAGYTAWAMQA
jgi:hypothetical protein